MKYFALLTKLGENLLAQATALGTKLELTHMAVGDGGGSLPTPDTNQTKLVKEQRRAAINTLFIDEKNPNQIIAEQIIPESEGGWFIREIGLFDKAGNLIAVANCPETYKPQLTEGSGRTQAIRMVLIVSHTESVTLKIDPSVVLATREYVDDSVKNAIEVHAKSRKHPDASTSAKGFVQLSDVLSTDNSKAITPKLATEINQRAISAQASANAANTAATNANNNANGRVPSGRKINNKSLVADISLTAGDVGAYTKTETDSKVADAKKTGVDAQVTANAANTAATNADNNANGRVPNSRKVNNKPLSNDINLTASDIGAQPKGDYATKTDLTSGLNQKFDKTGGAVDGGVTGTALGVTRKSINSTLYLYPAPDSQTDGYAYFQYKIGSNWFGRVEVPRPVINQTTRLMQVGDFGVGISLYQSSENLDSTTLGCGFYAMPGGADNPWGGNGSAHTLNVRHGGNGFQIGRTTGDMNLSFRLLQNGIFSSPSAFYSTANTQTDHNGNVKIPGYLESSDYPVGCPIPWPQSSVPAGYLICNGQSFNKATYPLLAEAYPTGVLPDLRGEFLRGLDAGRGVDVGRTSLSSQLDENKDHNHNIILKNANGSGRSEQYALRTLSINVSDATYSTEKSGGKESRPRNIAFLYIVRAA